MFPWITVGYWLLVSQQETYLTVVNSRTYIASLVCETCSATKYQLVSVDIDKTYRSDKS
jgi:hypothetical protein